MIGLLLGIAAAVAAGALITYVVAMTFEWLRNKIKVKLAQREIRKVFVGGVNGLVKEAEKNGTKLSLEELERMGTHVVASLDVNDQIVGDIELVRDTNENPDAGVARLLGREEMVVVEG